jgi:hypothetical protein
MPFLHSGVGDGAAVGVGVDQHDLVVPGRGLQARVLAASSRLVGTKRRPRPKPGAPTASKGCSKRRRVVEVAAALDLPLPTARAVAVTALAGPLDLGRGPLKGGADLVGRLCCVRCGHPGAARLPA